MTKALHPHRLTLYLALAPLIAVHASYALGIHYEQLPACLPYIDGCVSISASGRALPGRFLFKPMLIAQGVLLILFWRVIAVWLLHQGASRHAGNTITAIGTIGALFLIIYVTFLGHPGDIYNFLRRFGVIIFFAFTALAQLLAARELGRHGGTLLANAARLQQFTLLAMVLAGLASIPAQHFLGIDGLDNAVEWSLALLMQANFGIYWWMQRETGFELR